MSTLLLFQIINAVLFITLSASLYYNHKLLNLNNKLELKVAKLLFYAKQNKKHVDSLYSTVFRSYELVEDAGIALIEITGEVRQCNEAFCIIAGYKGKELRGMTWMSFTFENDIYADSELAQAMQDGKIEDYIFYKRYENKSKPLWDQLRYVRLDVSIRRDHFGEPLNFLSIIYPVTKEEFFKARGLHEFK